MYALEEAEDSDWGELPEGSLEAMVRSRIINTLRPAREPEPSG